ncbi:MAG TPA: Gx transporter family protein [Mariprofundaceae bacterium]|nr:Gx transporter family protein [Mariprofundaceae bacterium]
MTKIIEKSSVPPRPSLESLEHKAVWLAFVLLAIGLHVFEAALPSLGPWFKFGLANIMTLLALMYLGARAAFTLAIARVIIGSMFIGTLFTPTFFISLAGALTAATVMVLLYKIFPRISLISLSVLAAVAHMSGQFVTVETWFIQQSALYYLLPPLLALSCISGWINGAIATYIWQKLKTERGL